MNLNLVKLCVPGTERNPFTNRCNRKCKKGNERIRLDQTKTYRCYKTCVKPKKRNTQTNRCHSMVKTVSKPKSISNKSNLTRPSYKSRSTKTPPYKMWGDDSRSNSYRY